MLIQIKTGKIYFHGTFSPVNLTVTFILLKCGKYILKNKEVQEKKTLIIPIFGAFTSSILIISIIIIVISYILPPVVTKTLFITNKYYMQTDVARIEQSIGERNILEQPFFRYYEEIIPSWYIIRLKNISSNVNILRINSIYLIANENEQNILDKNKNMFVIDDFEYGVNIMYELKFDYKSIDVITIIYNIDIELRNGEIINVEEKAEYKKEIWRNNKRVYK